MGLSTVEKTLELVPRSRLDVLDVAGRFRDEFGGLLSGYKKALYHSYHTTAGYFEQSLCARLNHSRDSLQALVRSFQNLFPPNADYHHDQLHLRSELDDRQRLCEPRNADSHLTFIGSGLSSSVTYRNGHGQPVYLVDLDGINGDLRRRRCTTVIGFNREREVARVRLNVPVSTHPIDSVNLKDPRLGIYEQLQEIVNRHEVVRGRIDISLAPREHHAGLTVNEYETLLMKHDLVEVLRNPFRFMAEKSSHMLRDPRAIPSKARNYAKYDLVHVVNQFIDALGLSNSLLERMVDKFLAVPAERFLWMKRSVKLLVSDREDAGRGSIVHGTYQSPILVQWKKAAGPSRLLEATVFRLD